MRYKLVRVNGKNKIILAGKIENENPLIEKIHRKLFELEQPHLKGFPYKDCRKVYKVFEKVKGYKIFVRGKVYRSPKIYTKIIKKISIKNKKLIHRLNSKTSKFFTGNLVPDLDLMFSHINGLSMNVAKPDKLKLSDLKKYNSGLKKSFFQEFKQYKPLQEFIMPGTTPSLYTHLRLYDDLRLLLIELLPKIIEKKELESNI